MRCKCTHDKFSTHKYHTDEELNQPQHAHNYKVTVKLIYDTGGQHLDVAPVTINEWINYGNSRPQNANNIDLTNWDILPYPVSEVSP